MVPRMPAKKRNVAKKRPAGRGGFVCPECGFRAKHAMGLGRHRMAIHGVPSQRDRAMKGRRADGRTVAALGRRLDRLEKQVAVLLHRQARGHLDTAKMKANPTDAGGAAGEGRVTSGRGGPPRRLGR
jgi:hypothetical protein